MDAHRRSLKVCTVLAAVLCALCFVAPAKDASREQVHERDLTNGLAEPQFMLGGSAGEQVPVTTVAPPPAGALGGVMQAVVLVVDVEIGAGSKTAVSCTAGRCSVVQWAAGGGLRSAMCARPEVLLDCACGPSLAREG
jgi:hypothetical protein